MRQSQFFIPTLKEIPADAQMPSHQLMLRAGLIRQVSAGVFSWLPFGYRVLKKIIGILREEMDRIGGQEYLMPALNPIEIWEQTGRASAMKDIMFHIKDSGGFVLAPTHEEIIAYHASHSLSSYRDLPQIWYQIQNKFRNELRPRSGVMRTRQFLMKDSYSLDATVEGLNTSYDKHAEAYKKIFQRCGIKFFIAGAYSGAMGGSRSQEFMVENEYGEDTCAVNYTSGYAANLEIATSALEPVGRLDEDVAIEKFATPNTKTINDLVHIFDISKQRCAKSVVYIIDSKPVLILMRGDDELNEFKLESALGTPEIRAAEENEIIKIFGAKPGSIGPVEVKSNVKIIADSLLRNANGMVSGANEDGFHFRNIDLERDCQIDAYFDLRTVREGEPDPSDGRPLKIVKAIEAGHIFKLGTRYSEALHAVVLDENGQEKPILMGSYGLGVERLLACIIEQNHDEQGIKWEKGLTPFQVHLLGLAIENSDDVKKVCEEIYETLRKSGYDVLLDDRKKRTGFKFNDADLLGIPLQIIVGERGLKKGKIEVKYRHTGDKADIEPGNAVEVVKKFYGK